MKRPMRILSLVLATALAACGSSSTAGSGATTTAGTAATADPASAAIAAQLGVSENVVAAGLAAARAALGTGGEKTDADKTAAAQVGVEKASAQAEAEGKPLAEEQKTTLLEGLKSLL
jgi:hypothetical protein